MVDRRSLVVGGGAAALAAVVGGLSPAPAFAGAKSTGTAEHVRRVLGSLDVDRGLGDVDGVLRQLSDSVESYEKSAPRDPEADDLYAWIQQRVTDLTGRTEPFEEVVFELPETQTLLAFAFAVHTQQREPRPTPIAKSMPVPPVMAKLEPDFFPELCGRLEAATREDLKLARLLETSAVEMEQVITKVAETVPDADPGTAALAARPSKWRTVATVMLLTFVILAQGSYTC